VIKRMLSLMLHFSVTNARSMRLAHPHQHGPGYSSLIDEVGCRSNNPGRGVTEGGARTRVEAHHASSNIQQPHSPHSPQTGSVCTRNRTLPSRLPHMPSTSRTPRIEALDLRLVVRSNCAWSQVQPIEASTVGHSREPSHQRRLALAALSTGACSVGQAQPRAPTPL